MSFFWRQSLETKNEHKRKLSWASRDLLWIAILAVVTFILYECGSTRPLDPSSLVKVHTGRGTAAQPTTRRSGVCTTLPTGSKFRRS